jgi:hypothetical protein
MNRPLLLFIVLCLSINVIIIYKTTDLSYTSESKTSPKAKVKVYAISGKITADGNALAGVAVILEGKYSDNSVYTNTRKTDTKGNYQFSEPSGNYTVYPNKAYSIFSPPRIYVKVNNANVTDINFSTNMVAAKSIRLPKTGQTNKYVRRDDGDLKKGVAWPILRFVDNKNGTITDKLTGLVWLKKADCFGEISWRNALISASNLASGVCELSDDSVVGDWRLPNIVELESLIDYSMYKPSLPKNHPFIEVRSRNYYWSSSISSDHYEAWAVSMHRGEQVAHKTDISLCYHQIPCHWNHVWPVRNGNLKTTATKLPKTGQTFCSNTKGYIIACEGTGQDGDKQIGTIWPTLRFKDNNNGTVTDNLTKLVWLKNANCYGRQVWAEAIKSANALASGKCNLNDGSNAGQWRLPNIKELQSLVDHSMRKPSITNNPFANVGSFYWSSTSSAETIIDRHHDHRLVSAWGVRMDAGHAITHFKDWKDGYVWPVRDAN